MIEETWELKVRKVIEDCGLIAGYAYEPYIGGYSRYHNRERIPICIEADKVILRIGIISHCKSVLPIYGRDYVEEIKNLATQLQQQLGFQYTLILREESPEIIRVKGILGSFLWKAFGVEP